MEKLTCAKELGLGLDSLAGLFVQLPVSNLALFAAVECHGVSAAVFGVGAAYAASGCRLAAGRTSAARRGLSGHGRCDVEGNVVVEEKAVV